MSYCTVPDIEAYYLNKDFKCESYCNTRRVEMFIAQDAAIIDAALRVRYSLPITNTDDLLILKGINEKMVVGTIDDIFREKTESGDFERTRGMRKEALDWLKQLKEGDVVLNSTGKSSVMKFNTTDSQGNTVEKRFKDSNIEPTVTTMDRERRTISSSS